MIGVIDSRPSDVRHATPPTLPLTDRSSDLSSSLYISIPGVIYTWYYACLSAGLVDFSDSVRPHVKRLDRIRSAQGQQL